MSRLSPTVRKPQGAGVLRRPSPGERRGQRRARGRWARFTPCYLSTASAEQLMGALSALPQHLGWGSCPSHSDAQGALTAPSPCTPHPDSHTPWPRTCSGHFTDSCIGTPHRCSRRHARPTGGPLSAGSEPCFPGCVWVPQRVPCLRNQAFPSLQVRQEQGLRVRSGGKWRAQGRRFDIRAPLLRTAVAADIPTGT